jgi:RNA polymerase sigma-70 factor (ECF subfamily)
VALDAGDDALQETMVAIITNIGDLRDPAALRGWVRRIAVREAVRVARARGGGGTGVAATRSAPVDPADLDVVVAAGGGAGAARTATGDGTLAVDVRRVLADLAPEHRAVLVLTHYEGLGEDEAATVLGVAPGTVKSRLHRARAAFRTRWTA